MAKIPITTREHIQLRMIDLIATATKDAGLKILRTMVHTTRYPRDTGIAMTIKMMSVIEVATAAKIGMSQALANPLGQELRETTINHPRLS
jgi:hypothetical protein